MNDLISEARELSSKATPGPWRVPVPYKWRVCTFDEIYVANMFGHSKEGYEANAAFIARSRTLVPELADALEKALEEKQQEFDLGTGYHRRWEKALDRAEKAEAEFAAYKQANPPRVHGEWVVDECDTTDAVPSSAWIEFHCSECNTDYGLEEGQYDWCRDKEIPYHFCPNCGADMRANEAAQAALKEAPRE